MIHEEKKVGKIVEELTMFFFSIGGTKMSSSIEKDGNEVKIKFQSNFLPENISSVERLEQYLAEEKNEAIEDVYWQLAGSGDPGETTQLLLIGMMIDKYQVEKSEDEVTIYLLKELLV